MTHCKLGDHISIKHGYAFDGEFFTDEDNGVVLVTPGNFAIGGGYQEGKGKYFTGEYPEEFVLQPGDLIVTMTDLSKRIDTLGYGALVPDDGRVYLHNQRIGLVQFNDDEVDKHYLSFLMRSYDYQRTIAGSSSGSTVHHSSPDKICSYEFDLPSLGVQCRIASILMAYDNLIENNRRQIALLEEAAQRLYKEWFVDLRFPGHEEVEVVDGVLLGWKRLKLPEFAGIQYGFAFKSSEFNTKGLGLPIVRIRNVPAGISDDYTTEVASSNYLVDDRDVLIGMDGDFYINTWHGGTAWLVQRSCCIRPLEEGYRGYIEQALRAPIAAYQQGIVGATVAHLGKKHLDTIDVLVPPVELCEPLEEFAQQRLVLHKLIQSANEARNRLLPKLMSGEIEVEG